MSPPQMQQRVSKDYLTCIAWNEPNCSCHLLGQSCCSCLVLAGFTFYCLQDPVTRWQIFLVSSFYSHAYYDLCGCGSVSTNVIFIRISSFFIYYSLITSLWGLSGFSGINICIFGELCAFWELMKSCRSLISLLSRSYPISMIMLKIDGSTSVVNVCMHWEILKFGVRFKGISWPIPNCGYNFDINNIGSKSNELMLYMIVHANQRYVWILNSTQEHNSVYWSADMLFCFIHREHNIVCFKGSCGSDHSRDLYTCSSRFQR